MLSTSYSATDWLSRLCGTGTDDCTNIEAATTPAPVARAIGE
ncbi:hypothetical protein [Amycolatopsis sp. lyj-108]